MTIDEMLFFGSYPQSSGHLFQAERLRMVTTETF